MPATAEAAAHRAVATEEVVTYPIAVTVDWARRLARMTVAIAIGVPRYELLAMVQRVVGTP